MPPDILDFSTSTDMVVQEGINVTLKCAARGSPPPIITWRREGNDLITLPNGEEGEFYSRTASAPSKPSVGRSGGGGGGVGSLLVYCLKRH